MGFMHDFFKLSTFFHYRFRKHRPSRRLLEQPKEQSHKEFDPIFDSHPNIRLRSRRQSNMVRGLMAKLVV